MRVSGNVVEDCGDTGILVSRDAEGDDGTIVTGNRVSNIRADSGGTGQNGNGINLDKANGVIVADNRVDDCAFSAIRCFSSDTISVTDNICTHSGEMALYVEFAFEGAIVANNLIDGGNGGISFANFFEHGGRLGVCSGNIVRNIRGGPTYPDGNLQIGAGIAAEADVAITGNVVEDAVWGLQLGWGPYLRDVTATGNVIRRTKIGIAVSVVEGAGPAVISDNLIAEAERGAILGTRWDQSGDRRAGRWSRNRPNVTVSGNRKGLASASRAGDPTCEECDADESHYAQSQNRAHLAGRVKRERADEYAKYLYEVGIRPLEEKALGVEQLREDREDETEFVTISYWESVEAMSRFAGKDPRKIHHLPRDAEFLIEVPESVQVLQITARGGKIFPR